MRKSRRSILGLGGAALAALLPAGRAAQAATAPTSQGGTALGGSWVVSVTAQDQAPWSSLLTFTPDGGFLRSGEAQPLESEGHGTWTRSGDRQYDVTYVALRFDADHRFLGTRQANLRINVNATFDALTGEARAQVLDEAGNVLSTPSATFQGTRIAVEPFA
jgi:hypothetical protein